MKRGHFLLLGVWLFSCGGAESPVQSADSAQTTTPAAEPPAASAVEKPAAAEEGAWEGEAQATTEKASAAESGKSETRTMEVIAKIVKDNRQPVRDCFDKAKKDLPDLTGDMTIHFVVDPQGKVKKAELNQERSSLKAATIVDCAIKVIQGLSFPPSSRGMDTTVNYPFNFK